ncbi:hypothetical protein ACQEU3_46250 [Spirillospora sp. CA-253888]
MADRSFGPALLALPAWSILAHAAPIEAKAPPGRRLGRCARRPSAPTSWIRRARSTVSARPARELRAVVGISVSSGPLSAGPVGAGLTAEPAETAVELAEFVAVTRHCGECRPMIGYVIVALVAFAAGVAVAWWLKPGGTSIAPPPEPARDLSGTTEAVTAFGEQLDELTFEPAGPQASPAAVRDYRLALDAYDRAKAADSRQDVLAALHEGRAALVRLEARTSGRPVPIDALPAPEVEQRLVLPETATGERFLTVGGASGKTEVLIDRPVPGEPAIAEIAFSGDGNFIVHQMIRTSTRVDRLTDAGVNAIDAYQGRLLLPVECTHLQVECSGGEEDRSTWSVRILPAEAAVAFTSELDGQGDEVVFYGGGPGPLTVQTATEGTWALLCLGEDDRLEGEEHSVDEFAMITHGLGDGMQTAELRGPLLLMMNLDDGGRWSLHAGG